MAPNQTNKQTKIVMISPCPKDNDDDEGKVDRRPGHIVNCVCFLSVKAAPAAKTPIFQISSWGGGRGLLSWRWWWWCQWWCQWQWCWWWCRWWLHLKSDIGSVREDVSLVLTYSGVTLEPSLIDPLLIHFSTLHLCDYQTYEFSNMLRTLHHTFTPQAIHWSLKPYTS